MQIHYNLLYNFSIFKFYYFFIFYIVRALYSRKTENMTNTLAHTKIQAATASAATASAAAAATAAAATATTTIAAYTPRAPQATETNTTNTAITSQKATETIHNSQAMIRSVETQTETPTYKDTISFQNDVFTEIIQKCENIKENIQNLIKASDIEIQTIIREYVIRMDEVLAYTTI